MSALHVGDCERVPGVVRVGKPRVQIHEITAGAAHALQSQCMYCGETKAEEHQIINQLLQLSCSVHQMCCIMHGCQAAHELGVIRRVTSSLKEG